MNSRRERTENLDLFISIYLFIFLFNDREIRLELVRNMRNF